MEYKFRSWDKVTKKMRPVYHLNLIDGARPGLGKHTVDWYQDDRLELIQYTGRKDKNGVEIYADDIVQWPSHLVGKKRGAKDRGVVTYMPDSMGYWLTRLNGSKASFTGTVNLWSGAIFVGEVIGNIRENPNLLTTTEEKT